MNQNHVSIWNWIQKYKPKKVSTKRKRIAEFISNETIIKFSYHFIWLWITIESIQKEMLGISSRFIERNMFVAEKLISNLIKIHGKNSSVSTEMEAHGIHLKHVNFKTKTPPPFIS